MGRGNWYKKWLDNRSFIIENDRLKEKAYVFPSFPRCDSHGFIDGNVRPYIIADMYSRYLRMRDKNVLMPIGFNTLSAGSFIESKHNSNLLDDKISDMYKETLEELGVGINDLKLVNMRHDEYVSNLQLSFIDLYERGYIEYKNTIVYYDENKNKIYDSLNKPDIDLPRITEKCFVLKIDNMVKQIILDINNYDISQNIKDKLINLLEPKDVLCINFSLSSGKNIEIEIEHPEYLGGASYILMNPEYVNISDYIDPDEISGVNEYLENGTEAFAYTGIDAINPLTGNRIPLFVSTAISSSFYLGIPILKEEDMIYAKNAGFEIINIFDDDNLLINSDFLDGLSLEEAREKLIKAFLDAEIVSNKRIYKKREINLSSYDTFGALFPFLYDKAGYKLNSLKNFLPYNFSSQFRPILDPNVDLLGDSLDGSINNLFSTGIAPFISIIYDEFNADYEMTSEQAKEDYFNWLPIKLLIVNEASIIDELLMPIIFHNILKRELGYDLPNLAEKIIIIPKVYDNFMISINRANNNTIDFTSLLKEYYADSIRYYYLTSNMEDKFVFNKYDLDDYDKFVKYLRQALLRPTDNETSRLDFYFADFASKATKLLDEYRFNDYITLIKNFSMQYVIKEIPSNLNILTFIRIIFPIMPYLAEEVYEEKFKGRYSIINEGWID